MEVTGNAGDTLVVLTLPFGSYTPEQPAADIEINATLSGDADLGTPLAIQTRAGFGFGTTPANDPATDPSVIGAFRSDDVTPTLLSLEKEYLGPESETASGPNFPRAYELTATIAPGQSLTSFSLVDDLPANVALSNDFSGSSLDANGNGPTVVIEAVPGGAAGEQQVRATWARPSPARSSCATPSRCPRRSGARRSSTRPAATTRPSPTPTPTASAAATSTPPPRASGCPRTAATGPDPR